MPHTTPEPLLVPEPVVELVPDDVLELAAGAPVPLEAAPVVVAPTEELATLPVEVLAAALSVPPEDELCEEVPEDEAAEAEEAAEAIEATATDTPVVAIVPVVPEVEVDCEALEPLLVPATDTATAGPALDELASEVDPVLAVDDVSPLDPLPDWPSEEPLPLVKLSMLEPAELPEPWVELAPSALADDGLLVLDEAASVLPVLAIELLAEVALLELKGKFAGSAMS